MERGDIREKPRSTTGTSCAAPVSPDFAALNPGYDVSLVSVEIADPSGYWVHIGSHISSHLGSHMGAKRPPALDRIDIRILAVLQRDGRSTIARVAEKVGLSPRACLERVRRLEVGGLIVGYQAIIAVELLSRPLTV